MQTQVTITQSLTTIDLFKASVLLGLGNKRLRIIFYLIPSIIIVTSLVSIVLSNKEDRWFEIFNMLGSLAFVAIIFCTLFFVLSFLMIRIKPKLYKNVSYTFNNLGMIKSAKDSEFTRPWNKFVKWRETKSFILLYVSENDAHFILKRYITKEDSKLMMGIIEKHLGLFPSAK